MGRSVAVKVGAVTGGRLAVCPADAEHGESGHASHTQGQPRTRDTQIRRVWRNRTI